jgi:MtN3 and saliva related transmembrane protein
LIEFLGCHSEDRKLWIRSPRNQILRLVAMECCQLPGELNFKTEILKRIYALKQSRRTVLNRPILTLAVLLLSLITLCACHDLVPHDAPSLLDSRLQRSEIFGFLAGFGTTFAALPDLVAMLRRRSSAGMNPRMAAIMGVFQILWVYYGLLIASRPVIGWNVVAVFINFLSVGAYLHFSRKEKSQ